MPVTSALVILVAVTSVFAVISVYLFGGQDAWNFGARPAVRILRDAWTYCRVSHRRVHQGGVCYDSATVPSS